MRKQNATENLILKIKLLQSRQAREGADVKESFLEVLNNLNPINLIRSTFHDVVHSPEIGNDVFGAGLGLAGGYLSKLLLLGNGHNPIKNILGAIVQSLVGNVISKNSNSIKSVGGNLILHLIKLFQKSPSPAPVAS